MRLNLKDCRELFRREIKHRKRYTSCLAPTATHSSTEVGQHYPQHVHKLLAAGVGFDSKVWVFTKRTVGFD